MNFFNIIGLFVCFYYVFLTLFLRFYDCNFQLAFFEKFGKQLVNFKGKVVWITDASTELGKLDILIINNDKKQKGLWENIQLEEEFLLFHSNVFGIISLSRIIIKYFNSLKKGKLAILSSVAGLLGIPYSGSYSATKHALHGYYNCLKIEKLGFNNVGTTLLCPGSSKFSENQLINPNKLAEEGQVPQKKNKKFKKEMTVERCAHLCLTAIINNLDEAWMATFPTLPLLYGMKFYPNITKYVLNYLKARER